MKPLWSHCPSAQATRWVHPAARPSSFTTTICRCRSRPLCRRHPAHEREPFARLAFAMVLRMERIDRNAACRSRGVERCRVGVLLIVNYGHHPLVSAVCLLKSVAQLSDEIEMMG